MSAPSASIDAWLDAVVDEQLSDLNGEARLLAPLISWLARTRRINRDTRVALELAWLGRHVDVATLTQSRRTAAYELKLRGLGRALEQAAYNRLAFDRSYVVTESLPRADNIALATEHGIGLIIVHSGRVEHLVDSPRRAAVPELRSRLLTQLRLAAHLGDV